MDFATNILIDFQLRYVHNLISLVYYVCVPDSFSFVPNFNKVIPMGREQSLILTSSNVILIFVALYTRKLDMGIHDVIFSCNPAS